MTKTDEKSEPHEEGDEAAQEEGIFESDVEEKWGEASSIRGLDPSLMSKKLRRQHHEGSPMESAAFSPWLIPVSAILTGPVVASLLAIFADGDPPTMRQIVVVIAVGCSAWAINMGLSSQAIELFGAGAEATVRIGVLTASGLLLWALYMYWIDGKRQLDQQGLVQSAILLFVMSFLFWVGRGTDWWAWMGR